jgi:hypothetical protein
MSTPPLTVDRLLSAPLPELLAEAGVEIVAAPASADMTFGRIEGRPGAARLTMPTGRSAFMQDTVARILVAKLYGAPMRPVPPTIGIYSHGGTQ